MVLKQVHHLQGSPKAKLILVSYATPIASQPYGDVFLREQTKTEDFTFVAWKESTDVSISNGLTRSQSPLALNVNLQHSWR
jgi:hypothetical protein